VADWAKYASEGDQWIICYALVSGISSTQTAALYIIGHAVELYLKAASIKLSDNEAGAIKYGHCLKRLWKDCRRLDPCFMSTYDIRFSTLAKDIFDPKVIGSLSADELRNFDSHRSLYAIMRALPDLKYFGLPWKTEKTSGSYYVVTEHRDRYWIRFFKDMRTYLGYPANQLADRIRNAVAGSDLPADAVAYLKKYFE